jgi:hypothetical protein
MEASTHTCKRVKQSFPLSNMGARVLSWCLQPPQILCLISNHQSPLGRYLGVGLLLLSKLHGQFYSGYSLSLSPSLSPTLFFFSVEVENSGVLGRR